MQEQDRKEIQDIVEKTAKHYMPITRINFSQVLQGLILAGIIWIGAEFQNLSQKSVSRDTEIKTLQRDISELKGEIRYLRQALFEHNKADLKK